MLPLPVGVIPSSGMVSAGIVPAHTQAKHDFPVCQVWYHTRPADVVRLQDGKYLPASRIAQVLASSTRTRTHAGDARVGRAWEKRTPGGSENHQTLRQRKIHDFLK